MFILSCRGKPRRATAGPRIVLSAPRDDRRRAGAAPARRMVAARLAPQLCGAQQAASSGDVGGRPRLLRRQEDAAEASGLAPTEFKKRLRTGDVPANYGDDSKRPKSFDAEVLRLWALSGYPGNFDRERPAEWIAWLYEQHGMTPAGLPLAK